MTVLGKMDEILRLTRDGRLQEATALIRQNLAAAPTAHPATTDGEAREIHGDADASPGLDAGVSGAGKHGSMLERLRRFKPRLPLRKARPAAPPPKLVDGATWEWREQAGLRYRLFLPSIIAEGKAPRGVLLMLHGCTQDADDFATGTRIIAQAEGAGLVVIAPEQTPAANPNRCWNWFHPHHQNGGEAGALAALAQAIAREHGVPAERVFAAGLSAGGAMAATLGATRPDIFAAVAVHSGLAHGAASDMPGAFAAMSGNGAAPRLTRRPARLLVFHGSADRTVAPQNADAVTRQYLGAQDGLSRSVRGDVQEWTDGEGVTRVRQRDIPGLAHAWSGGAAEGSHTAPGPDATAEMIRFFLD